MRVGDHVHVKLRRGEVQSGTVTRVLPDGRFRWKNVSNFERTAKPSDLTTAAERPGRIDPYLQEWVNEPGDGERDPQKKRVYIVYVAKVDGATSTSLPTYYVGSTARGLRLRRRQHRSGRMSHRHCLGRLIPVMRVPTRAMAERGEAEVARALRKRGFRVQGGRYMSVSRQLAAERSQQPTASSRQRRRISR